MANMAQTSLADLEGLKLFEKAGRPVCIKIDLDALIHNTNLMRKHCRNHDVGIMAVLKSDCYGHGAVQLGRHLTETRAAERLAVATVVEGILLRKANIGAPIHIFGNVQDWEMSRCVKYNLIPSISDVKAVAGMAKALKESAGAPDQNGTTNNNFTKDLTPRGAVHIKLDTGMKRNGCQPEEVESIVKACDVNNVPLEGIFSHFANFEDKEFTSHQLELFDKTTDPFKDRGLLLHIAAAGAILNDQGSHYDMVRPGITLLGQPADSNVEAFAALGFKPTLEVKGIPTLVKLCGKGSPIGYACAYTCPEDEWIGTFPIGYADGYWRSLSLKGVHIKRDKTGEKCPVVGKVSMDSISVRLPCKPDADEVFTLITADFDPQTSIMAICKMVDSIPQEALARLSLRIPRVYISQQRDSVEVVEAHGFVEA